MSKARICINFERPDFASKRLQGHRGPFAPVIMSLQTLVAINKWQLRQRNYPLLYESGIYYHTESSPEDFYEKLILLIEGRENCEWHDIPTLLAEGRGDCKDLVAYRVAELSHYFGIDAKPIIKWRWEKRVKRDNRGNPFIQKFLLIHVLVQYPDGKIEDPSKILGMGGEYQ